ncbi:MAG: DUF3450 family protein [Luteolibacter sp.]|jgi:hypothetical protein
MHSFSNAPRFFHAFLACIALHGGVCADENAASLEELRATISSIVEVQSQASKELRDWEARKAVMADLLDVHRREIELLDEELASSGRSAPGHDEVVIAAQDEIAALRETRAKLMAAVDRARPRVLAMSLRFPRPLAAEIESEIASLAAWKPGDEPREALQPLLGVLSKAAQFNRRISRSLEVIDGREVEVLYLGLARAYYADRSGVAGTGAPADGGWEWRADGALNRNVLRAFDILDQKRPPARIELPMQIE